MAITETERKCDYCQQRKATETIGTFSLGTYRYCDGCANVVLRQPESSAHQLTTLNKEEAQ